MWQIISNYIGIFFLGFGEIAFAQILLNQKPKTGTIQIVLILLISSLAYALGATYIEGAIKSVLLCGLHVFEFKLLFKLSYYKSIFLSFLLFTITLIPDLLSLLIITKIVGISKIICYNEVAGSILSHIIIGVLLVVVTLILKKPLRKIMNKEISDNAKIVLLSILTLGCIAIFFYNFIKEFEINGNVIPSVVVMIIFATILFSLIKQIIKNNTLLNQYDKLLEFMVTYENEIENQRILRHEIKNEFRTIRAKICDNQENKEIIEYIDEIVNDKYKVNKEKYAKFGYLPPNGIKGLCYFKTQEAEDKGINVSLNISKKIKESTIYNLDIKQQRDFGRILGVFLDNAIEASIESKEKQIGIEAYTNTKKEFKMIISNTYKNKIDKNKLGKESFSTKGKNRGHGLLLVKQLTGKNSIFETKTEIQENIYIQTIEIKKL